MQDAGFASLKPQNEILKKIKLNNNSNLHDPLSNA